MVSSCPLLNLPTEVFSLLFLHLSVDAFVQLTQTCKYIYHVGSRSRDAVLQHVNGLPGVKPVRNCPGLSTPELFAILRGRASLNLIGAAYHADCQNVRFEYGTLDAKASCLTDDADYLNVSLVLKESGIVRHLDSLCQTITESTQWPYADGFGRILQIVHKKSTISVLYVWTPEESDADKLVRGSPTFRPVQPQVPLLSVDQEPKNVPFPSDLSTNRIEYHLVHYNAYNEGRPEFWIITPPQLELYNGNGHSQWTCDQPVPVHLAVHSRLKCAIIWDRSHLNESKELRASTAIVTMYAADRAPVNDVGCYTQQIFFPKSTHLNGGVSTTREREESDSDATSQDYLLRFNPRASAFSQDGKRLKLYAVGMLCPYAGLRARTNLSDRTGTFELATPKGHNLTKVNGVLLRTDNPFYGKHTRRNRSEQSMYILDECLLSYLQLAVETGEGTLAESTAFEMPREDGLYIIQSHDELAAIDCDHKISKDLYVLNETDECQRVVARLRGWTRHWPATNLTALDTVAISKRGTRIALAMWDVVLVYVINPGILCEDWSVRVEPDNASQASGQQSNSSHSTSSANSEGSSQQGDGLPAPSVSEAPDPKELYKINETAMIKAKSYYDLVEHADFGEIVEFWPIVLKLPQEAIARKMIWRSARDSTFEHDVPNWDFSEDDDQLSDSDVTDMPEQSRPAHEFALDIDNDRSHSDEGRDNMELSSKIEEFRTRDVQRRLLPDVQYSPFEAIAIAKAAAYQSIEAQRQTTSSNPDKVGELAQEDGIPPRQVNDDRDVDMGSAPATEPSVDFSTHDIFAASSDHARAFAHVDIQNDLNLEATVHSPRSPTVTTSDDQEEPKGKGKEKRRSPACQSPSPTRLRHRGSRPRKKRNTEDTLIILTDRGVQIWDLGAMAKGRREGHLLREQEGQFGSVSLTRV